MSLATLKTKVEQLIEKAQSDGESGAIDYPEWGFTRPSWWLPRPELTEGVDEVWFLADLPLEAEGIKYKGNIYGFESSFKTSSDAMHWEMLIEIGVEKKVSNSRKQCWIRATSAHWSKRLLFGSGFIDCDSFVEIVINSTTIIPEFSYFYNSYVFKNLKIITGTPITNSASNQEGFSHAYALTVVENEVVFTTSTAGNSNQFFSHCYSLKKVLNINTDDLYIGKNSFTNCVQLTEVGRVRFKLMENTFNGCEALTTLTLAADCSGLTTTTFQGCTSLKYLTVDEGFSASLYIHHSTQFTTEVLHAIIENFADMTGQTAPTFQVGATNLAKIDEEHKAMLEAKNINYL